MKAVQIMTWYSCFYDNKRTPKVSVEVAFDYLDNTLLFSFHRIYNYCRLNLISRRCCRLEQFFFFHYIIFLFIYRFFHYFFLISVYFFILPLQSWWHTSLSWFHCRHWWVCSGYPQLQYGQCYLHKYRRIVQLLMWSWIQRGWTQLCRCENFSKYDCFLVSASKTYIAWPSCPQKF